MNPHDVLGVAPDATPEQIKTAYRKLAMEHHPDRNGGSAEKFHELQKAYDMLRADKPKQEEAHASHAFHSSMHDMFDHFFTRRQHMMQATCEITLEQAFTGCTVNFNVNGKSVVVNIPAGIDNGQVIRIADAVPSPNPNFPMGELHVVIRMKRHDRFHRHGMTLLSKMNVDLLDLLTGCEKEIITITGERKKFRIPENSNPSTVITLTKEGMPVMNSDVRGDLMIHFEADFPTFTKKQLATLRKMKKP